MPHNSNKVCKTCNSKATCGCNDSALVIPTSFSNDPTVCPPSSETCSEVFPMECVCYQGPDIFELDIKKGDRLDEVLQKLILRITNPDCAIFEDDTVCQSPINLTISNLTATTFGISWDTVDIATSYQVEIKLTTSSTWLLNTAVTAPIVADTLVGLTPDTIYDVRVRAICPSDSCYSLNIRIKTEA